LAARGYTKVDEGGDFVVTFYSFSEEQVQYEQFDRTARGIYYDPIYVNSWDQGTLVISAVDPNAEKLLWTGWASDALDPSKPEKGEEQINEAVTMIFAVTDSTCSPDSYRLQRRRHECRHRLRPRGNLRRARDVHLGLHGR
jgi:hypothetical protein